MLVFVTKVVFFCQKQFFTVHVMIGYRHTRSKNNVISSVRKHNCALGSGLGLELGLELVLEFG